MIIEDFTAKKTKVGGSYYLLIPPMFAAVMEEGKEYRVKIQEVEK